MKITFLMPCYVWGPSGGARVIYEYANQLAERGHQVTLVHPSRCRHLNAKNLYHWIVDSRFGWQNRVKPSIDWHPIDPRVRIEFAPTSHHRYIPDSDAVFATAWTTAASVLEYPSRCGKKFYLIQGYETWFGPKKRVDATWGYPLHKVVISKWLLELGTELGCRELTYIPNGIDHSRFRLIRPMEDRPNRVAMMFSTTPSKGAVDGIEALNLAKEKYPALQAVVFGLSEPKTSIPKWIEYCRNPSQDSLVEDIYNGSAIYLCPSWWEGFSLPPAEAAACGCAVVSTDNKGIRNYIQNDVNGLLSPPKDPKALAENLLLLLRNQDLRLRFAEAANQAVKELRWERSAALLETLISRVVLGQSNAEPASPEKACDKNGSDFRDPELAGAEGFPETPVGRP